VAQAVECLLCKREAEFKPHATKKKKKRHRWEKIFTSETPDTIQII
jgi:hypothetical protein